MGTSQLLHEVCREGKSDLSRFRIRTRFSLSLSLKVLVVAMKQEMVKCNDY